MTEKNYSRRLSSIYLNRVVDNGIGGIEPDTYAQKPSSDFVLCRNAKGEATAIYGRSEWDFNPYRLSHKRIQKISFSEALSPSPEYDRKVYDQIKWILYNLIYHNPSSKSGKSSASTLAQHFYTLRKMARFCANQFDNKLIQEIDLNDVLSNVSYLKAFLNLESSTTNDAKQTSAVLQVLNQRGEKNIGFVPCKKYELEFERNEDKQHPVIPSRIYIEMMNLFDEYIDHIFPYKDNLKEIIIKMNDRCYGASKGTQKNQYRIRVGNYRPTMTEVIQEHGIAPLFEEGQANRFTRANFCVWLKEIQFVCKMTMHLYTGMRDQESARTMHGCIDEYEVSKSIVDETGEVLDPARVVNIISTTTKFAGYKKTASWLAPMCAIKSIELAKAIAEGLSAIYELDLSDTHLFINPSIIRSQKSKPTVSTLSPGGLFHKLAGPAFAITEADLKELSITDPDRNFYEDDEFQLGELWPLTSHQFRRSLAFYAVNSGFVSLDTVSTQFKHLSRLMAQYYARNSERFLPIFLGSEGARQITNHIAFDYQVASPAEVVNQLFSDVFEDDAPVFGGTGSYMEKMKARVDKGEISIMESKDVTIKMANDGHISYRETPLGGCTGVETCDYYLMGEFTDCLTCAGSVIKPSKVESMITKLKIDLSRYERGTAEYELTEMELSKLEVYKKKKLNKSGLARLQGV